MAATDQSNQNEPSDFMVTPGGYRHKSLVHQVDARVAVDVQADAICLVNIETAADANQPADQSLSGYWDVPRGGRGPSLQLTGKADFWHPLRFSM